MSGLLSVCLSCFQCLSELIGAGGGLHTAFDAFHAGDYIIDIHSLHESGNAFQVAIAASQELNIFNLVFLNIKINHLRAGALGFVLIHNDFLSMLNAMQKRNNDISIALYDICFLLSSVNYDVQNGYPI